MDALERIVISGDAMSAGINRHGVEDLPAGRDFRGLTPPAKFCRPFGPASYVSHVGAEQD